MIRLLREDLEMPNDESVLRMLLQQAVQRMMVTCPTCGHYARVTAEDEAECHTCLSVLKLSEGLWHIDR